MPKAILLCIRTIDPMENETYNELLQYLKKGIYPKDVPKETYRQWAKQFTEKNNHLYVEERRVIPRREVTTVISIYHDDPTIILLR